MAKPCNRRRAEPTDEGAWEHPSRDRSDRFAVDALIRRNGYSVFRRREGKPTLWSKDGRVYSQGQVLDAIDQDAVWGAEYLEKLYWDGEPSFVELSG
jgi:hypothetical protein